MKLRKGSYELRAASYKLVGLLRIAAPSQLSPAGTGIENERRVSNLRRLAKYFELAARSSQLLYSAR
jgi:hypothetical protein